MKEIDGREMQEHQMKDKNNTKKTDEDRNERVKDLEHEICVITWNVNKSSAQYDFVRDMVQCQANVVMFQETQNWQDDGTAEEMGWTLLKEKKEGKAAIAVKNNNMNLLRHSRRSTRWVLVVVESILFLSMYLPHTWGGEANLEEYCKTLQEIDRNMQDIRKKYQISGIFAGMDAQIEVKPRQEPFGGDGTRMSCGNAARSCEMDSKFESLLMEWITKHEVKLASTFCKGWEPTRAQTNKLDFWEQDEMQL